jgi:hypothetical protein
MLSVPRSTGSIISVINMFSIKILIDFIKIPWQKAGLGVYAFFPIREIALSSSDFHWVVSRTKRFTGFIELRSWLTDFFQHGLVDADRWVYPVDGRGRLLSWSAMATTSTR